MEALYLSFFLLLVPFLPLERPALGDTECQRLIAVLRNSPPGAQTHEVTEKLIRRLVKEGTTVYRGLSISPLARKKTLRGVLSSADYHKTRDSDHWTTAAKVAQDFTKGVYLNPDGTAGKKEDTVQLIIEAEIGPSDVDPAEFQRVVTGKGVTKAGEVDSYFRLDSENVGASKNEKELPILKSHYGQLKITAYWMWNPKTAEWERKKPEDNPAAFR